LFETTRPLDRPRQRLDFASVFCARKLTGAKYSGKIEAAPRISAFCDALQSLGRFRPRQEQRNLTAVIAP
jgi:hypothetical protein